MGIKTSDVLEILLAVTGLKLDELHTELQGLCESRGWCLTSLTSVQLREIMHEYLTGHMTLLCASQNNDDWSKIQPGFETIEA